MRIKQVLTSWYLWVAIGIFLVIAMTQRGYGTAALFPLALILICPIMMMLMMSGHDHGHKDE